MENLGRFKIVAKLGQGAFGMVYKGNDPILKRDAAIKVMSEATAADTDLVRRFRREAEAAAALNHRNIVTIYDLGEQDGLPYIAMEFLEGRDLQSVIKSKEDIKVEQKLQWLVEAAEGLHHAHERGIVHRDVKPANIFVQKNGTVKIVDFGIAKLESGDLTKTGQLMGTVNYMSPEQIRVQELDGRCDLFALGIAAYELLCYRRPFPGDSISGVIYKLLNEPPLPMKELQGTPNAWLEGIVLKCLEKDRDHRFESCQAFADALKTKQKVAVPTADLDSTMGEIAQLMYVGNFDAAVNETSRLMVHAPDSEAVRQHQQVAVGLQQAETLITSGRHGEAREQLGKLDNQSADFSDEVRRAIAEQVNKLEKKIRKNEAEILTKEAGQFLADGRFEQALEAVGKALAIDPELATARTIQKDAEAGKRQADIVDLLEDADRKLKAGDVAASRAAADKALAIDPYHRDAKAFLKSLEAEAERKQRSTAEQQHSLRIEELKQGLKAALETARRGQHGEARKVLEGVDKELRTDPGIKALIAEVESAIAAEQRQKDALAFTAKGEEYLKAKSYDEARLAFRKALDLDPEAVAAGRGLEAVKRAAGVGPAAKSGSGKTIAVALVGVVLAAVAIGLLLRSGDPATKMLESARASRDKGELVAAAETLAAVRQAEGSAEAHAAADQEYLDLVEPLIAAGHLQEARQVIDNAAQWGIAGALERNQSLAEAYRKSGDLIQSHDAYQRYFKRGYTGDQLEQMKQYLALGESLLAKSKEASLLAERVDLAQASVQVFELIKSAESRLPAAVDRLVSARDAHREAVELSARVTGLRTRLDGQLQKADAAFDGQRWEEAKGHLLQADDEIRLSEDLAGYVDLEAYRSRVGTLQEALTKASEGAEGEARRKAAVDAIAQAAALGASDPAKAVAAYRTVALDIKAPRDLRRDAVIAAKVLGQDLAPEMAKADLAEAQSRFKAGDPDSLRAARQLLEVIARATPQLPGLAELQGRVGDAIAASEVTRLRGLGEAARGERKLEVAKENFDKLLQLAPNDRSARQRVDEIVRLQRFRDSMSEARAALQAGRFEDGVLLLAQLRQGRLSRAESGELQTQLQVPLEDALKDQLRAGDFEGAKLRAERLLEVLEDNPVATAVLAEMDIVRSTNSLWEDEMRVGSSNGTAETKQLFEEAGLKAAISIDGQRIRRWAYQLPTFDEDRQKVLDAIGSRGCGAVGARLDALVQERPDDAELVAAKARCASN